MGRPDRRLFGSAANGRRVTGRRGAAREEAGTSIGQPGSTCGAANAVAKLLQRRESRLGASPANQFEMRPECGANPPLFEIGAGRLAGTVCPGGSRVPRSREGTHEGGRRPLRDGSLRAAWTGRGRGSRQHQNLERSLPLGDCRESRADASPDSVSSAAKRGAVGRESALPRFTESEKSLAHFTRSTSGGGQRIIGRASNPGRNCRAPRAAPGRRLRSAAGRACGSHSRFSTWKVECTFPSSR